MASSLSDIMHPTDGLGFRVWLSFGLARKFIPAACLVTLLSTATASGQSGTAAFDFDLPAQSLASALSAFSEETGMVGVYDGALALGRRSVRVHGRYAPETALRLLLSDSGLEAKYTNNNAFVVVPAAADAVVIRTPSVIGQTALAAQSAAQQRYSGRVQSVINQLLCAEPQTRPGDYRLAMSFRIGQSGQIKDPRLLSSTGDQQRDAAILSALQRVQFDGGPPPTSMAQPFTMIVLPRSSGGVVDCSESEAGRRNG